jgi:hypothetical protein
MCWSLSCHTDLIGFVGLVLEGDGQTEGLGVIGWIAPIYLCFSSICPVKVLPGHIVGNHSANAQSVGSGTTAPSLATFHIDNHWLPHHLLWDPVNLPTHQ